MFFSKNAIKFKEQKKLCFQKVLNLIMSDKLYITWDEFHQDVKNLVDKIREKGEFNRIIAVCRGGLIPAGILSYELDIRQCESIKIQSYDHYQSRDDHSIHVDENHSLQNVDEKTLIIDDLSDSGRTFQIVEKMFPRACRACVYAKPKGEKATNIFSRSLPDRWVVFPWDVDR